MHLMWDVTRERLALLALELKLTMSDTRDVQYTDICTLFYVQMPIPTLCPTVNLPIFDLLQ